MDLRIPLVGLSPRCPAQVRHGLDALRLDEQLPQPVECILWNLPFVADVGRGESVNAEPNGRLMRGFFAAAVRAAGLWQQADPSAPPPTIAVSLGIDQFADWGLLAVARDCFLHLKDVHLFEPSQHGAYAARRNKRDDIFDIGEMRTYCFSIDLCRLEAAVHMVDVQVRMPPLQNYNTAVQ